MTGRLFGALGTMLSLVALYLVLANSGGTTSILKTVGSSLTSIFRTLQGR